MEKIKKVLPWLLLFYIIFLLIGTLIPNWMTYKHVGIEGFKFRLDHVLHFLSYYGLGFLFLLWRYSLLGNLKTNVPFRHTWLLIVFAASTEIMQFWVPGRHFSVKDFVSNTLGIIVCLISFYIFKITMIWLLSKKLLVNNDWFIRFKSTLENQ